MRTPIIRFSTESDLKAEMTHWGRIVREGGLVAFPTETVYGLGANGLDERAVRKIFLAKGRPSDNPLILHVNNREMLSSLTDKIGRIEKQLIRDFWPGPLTLVFNRSSIVPAIVTGGGETVAVRAPKHTLAKALIDAAGVPIAAPSANLSGRPSPCNAQAVAEDMDGRIDAILDGGACSIGLESTVAACSDDEIIVYRPGAITVEMLQKYANARLDDALVTGQGVPKAPGMKYRHYAPQMPVFVYCGEEKSVEEVIIRHYAADIGFFVSAETAKKMPMSPYIYTWGERKNSEKMASHLYDGLLYLDRQPIKKIIAEGTKTEGLGTAIMNRLAKASGYHVKEVN